MIQFTMTGVTHQYLDDLVLTQLSIILEKVQQL